jgi:PIN domain nuclease of toxin-antitoxin system
MTLLIDTNVVYWLLNDEPQLGPKARDLLTDRTNRVLVSYFSFFEIAIKAASGKSTYDDSALDDLTSAGFEILYPTREILEAYRIYDPTNKDPFDNILLAVAQVEQCSFMTSDKIILANRTDGIAVINARN